MDVYCVKNQASQLMLSLDGGSYSFNAAIQICFSKSTFHCMTDDRFDSFPLMADKIRVRNTDKGFVVQSDNEVIKRCLYGVFWSFGNLSDRLSSLNPKNFM